jgi:hypothetical protein
MYSTVGVIKNAPLLKKCLEFWRFFLKVYRAIFPLFSLFCYQRTANLHMESFFWGTHQKEATKEGRKVEPFLKYKIF